MSLFAALGAVELGAIYALVAIGVYLSFRVLDFPDLTVDGSFPLGACVAASLISAGTDAGLATIAAMLAGAAAGFVTAYVSTRFGVLHLLASILVMVALNSVNLRVMGRPNVALLDEPTLLSPLLGHGVPEEIVRPLFVGVIVIVVATLLAWFLGSERGLAMRAVGANARMARAQGVAPARQIIAGIMLSNAIVALAGALFAQVEGFADVTLGTGTIVVGLAAVIIGETLLPTRAIALALAGCALGAVLYRVAIQLALNAHAIGLQASDLNLVTAALVLAALVLPRVRARRT